MQLIDIWRLFTMMPTGTLRLTTHRCIIAPCRLARLSKPGDFPKNNPSSRYRTFLGFQPTSLSKLKQTILTLLRLPCKP